MVGGDHFRRLSDGAAGPGGRGADGGLHLILHWLAGGCPADHVSCAGHCLVRTAIRPTGVLRGVSIDVLLVRRPRPRGQAQDRHFHDSLPVARRCQDGHGVRHVAHDFRLERALARHQFPGRSDRTVRHQRNSADHGRAARGAWPHRQHQSARGPQGVEGRAALLGDAAALVGDPMLARYLGNVVGLVLVLTTVPVFAAVLRVPFSAIAPMIVVSCAIGAYAIQNAMFDIWLMLVFGVVGYVFKKIGIPLAPFTLALVLGSRAEDAFRLAMIGAGGDLRVFWSNGLAGSITTLALILLVWPLFGPLVQRAKLLWRPVGGSPAA